jgi:hypothetical protein
MPITDGKYQFTQLNVDLSPNNIGVYELLDSYIEIYIGRASETDTIRNRLQSHLRGDEGTCTKQATHYRRQVCSNPVSRETELLEEYKHFHGGLPRCNQRIG